MNTKPHIIRTMIETAKAQSPHMSISEIKKWAEARFALYEKSSGTESAIQRLASSARYGTLIQRVSEILAPVAGEWVWDENDEGFRKIKDGIDPVSWLNAQIKSTEDDQQIIAAAKLIA